MQTELEIIIVEVTKHNGTWVAECDQLGIVTEAESYNGLVTRFMEVAPEMAELNSLPFDPATTQIRFEHQTTMAQVA
ncbi:DUF1902 domain-containing protein [Ectothiorhodospiraceae bacterium BW-2]|nr:DUF1902 domain-containing protein [Ectothiorhodospiraceae bacterium BW-2]